ncbi:MULTISPECIES: MarR family winged helix-turn-helix transcriptional regulator [Streptomyces]|uniref:MarR family winged helix-turn-helix transcriptional regulator n=1 Tax=Streptomyces TaxID=1883 RepID=UPI00093A16A6|nr:MULTISPECIES: MarR family winged helix-turn-helix transcriptional regulator [Streptomyces]MBX9422439.1 MarR family winged helix-turn-helix transcriptional regulator [Streptomyces lateritius]OKJ51476.1 MarR family transcriptional regulator [Streptomyces sp. CB02261]
MKSQEQPVPADDDSLLDNVGPALSRLRRQVGSGRGDLTRNIVLNVVGDAAGRITVGGVADKMGVAQPVASRAIAACIAEGLLRRVASQQDGRSSWLELTAEGESARRAYASEQRLAFEEITAHWSSADRLQFARFLTRYGQDASAWTARSRPEG